MNTRLTIRRPGRAAAVVGAVVAVSATALMALVAGTASADEPGRCVENVNVRAQPDVTSRIVALCEAGTEVTVGETRNGFVKLTDLGGWSAQEYVSVNGATPAAPASRPTPARPSTGGDAADSSSTPTTSSSAPTARRAPATTTPAAPAGAADAPAADDADVTTQPAPAMGRTFPQRTPAPAPAPTQEPAPEQSSPAGGLLG